MFLQHRIFASELIQISDDGTKSSPVPINLNFRSKHLYCLPFQTFAILLKFLQPLLWTVHSHAGEYILFSGLHYVNVQTQDVKAPKKDRQEQRLWIQCNISFTVDNNVVSVLFLRVNMYSTNIRILRTPNIRVTEVNTGGSVRIDRIH